MHTEAAECIGPYRLLQSLGRGGMGVVWHALREADGLEVALKTVRVADAGQLASIRREIHALAELSHPGIVRILEHGLHEGMPWYAMELLDGVTLRCWRPAGGEAQPVSRAMEPTATAASWWTQSLLQAQAPGQSAAEPVGPDSNPDLPAEPRPASLRPALGLVRRLCYALSYLHGEGIVHRDLKPDNILVRPDGQPVVVDFGLMSRSSAELSREALEVTELVSGTVAYMPPEQIRGERVDARADLYSLGCILYELITGRPPFVGRRAAEVVRQHLGSPPQRPSELVPGLQPELDELVLRLLEKKPRARLGYADDVSVALARLGIDAEPPRGVPPARAYLYRPGFTGRADVLEPLHLRLTALQSGRGGVVLIAGESGVGKTRLLVELARLASQEGLRVLAGECLPGVASREQHAATEEQDASTPLVTRGSQLGTASAPLQAFRLLLQSIADRCRERGELETKRLLGSRGRVLSAYEPAMGDLPGLDAHGPPAELPPKEALLRLYHCLLETLAASVEWEGELVLLLDDLQWADELSLGMLETLLRSQSLEKLPLLVVGVYRAEECGPALRKLVEAAGVGTLKLERLGGAAVAQIVSDMLGLSTPPRAFARFLLRQSEGNPFFVAEYLHAAVDAKLLYRDEEGRWQVAAPAEASAMEQIYASLPLPRSLLELVGGRLAKLGAEAQQLVEALSVLGREADAALLADVSGLHSSAVMKATVEVLSRQVLEPAGGERLRFVHDKLREVAYGGLNAGRRHELHRAAAEALEELPAAELQEIAAELGHHWEVAGEGEKAARYYLPAARRAVERYSHEEAERLYRAYLRLVASPAPESVEARLELGEKVLDLQGRSEEALAEYALAREEARGLGERRLEGTALRWLGWLKLQTGKSEEALQLCEQALVICREVGDRRSEATVLGNLSNLHLSQARAELALQLYGQALAIFREVGDRRGEGVVLGNLGIVHLEQGRPEQALLLYEQALAILREAGSRRSEGITLSNVGNVHKAQGRPEQARQIYEQALAILREVGDRRFEGRVLYETACLRRRGSGDLPEARRLVDAALELLRTSAARWLASGLCEAGHVALAESTSAAGLLAQARASAASQGAGSLSEAGKAVARLERAQAAFEAGEQQRLFRGELIEDLPEGLRRRLLEDGQLPGNKLR
jgi:eukaryotic-like serine/threonine-protein kinase